MKQLYSLSYDNFYVSEDVTNLESIEHLIEEHKKLEESGEFSALLYCNFVEDYSHYELKEEGNGDYELTLFFNENGDMETRTFTLRKCNIYIK